MRALQPDQRRLKARRGRGGRREVTGREREGESGIVGRVADTAQATR